MALLATAGLGSCVSNQEYQAAVDLAKQYQTDLLNCQAEHERLAFENERLRGMSDEATIRGLDRDLVGPVEARLDKLQDLIDNLDEGEIKDVMRFDVDSSERSSRPLRFSFARASSSGRTFPAATSWSSAIEIARHSRRFSSRVPT